MRGAARGSDLGGISARLLHLLQQVGAQIGDLGVLLCEGAGAHLDVHQARVLNAVRQVLWG